MLLRSLRSVLASWKTLILLLSFLLNKWPISWPYFSDCFWYLLKSLRCLLMFLLYLAIFFNTFLCLSVKVPSFSLFWKNDWLLFFVEFSFNYHFFVIWKISSNIIKKLSSLLYCCDVSCCCGFTIIISTKKNIFFFLFKVSKITILIMTCSKLAVLNKTIHDAF